MPVYRYQFASVDQSRLQKLVTGAPTVGSTGPNIYVDITVAAPSKDDLDAAMAQIGYTFVVQDPATTPAQQAAQSTSLSWKDAVRMATTANVALAGLQTIDTVVGVADDRVLVKNQAAPAENGLYLMKVGAWVRTSDADSGSNLVSGSAVKVSAGSQAGTEWYVSTANPITVGVTAITWAQFGSVLASTAPATVGTANAVGAGTTAARDNHVHDHGAQATSTQHAVASGAINGFMSTADFTKLAGLFNAQVDALAGAGNWSKPTGALFVMGFLNGGGGGGGGGAKAAASRTGGGGGSVGGMAFFLIRASSLGATTAYSVGAAGGGGAGATVNSTNGADGAAGGASTFGDYNALGGLQGQGGQAAGTATGGTAVDGLWQGEAGAGGTTGAGVAPAPTAAQTRRGSGGSGGGVLASVAAVGGNGGLSTWHSGAAAAGGTVGAGQAGANGANIAGFGVSGGGGGGASSITGVAGAGGTGGNAGGGGGGGGCGLNTGGNGGAGGNGGPGRIILVTVF